MFSESTKRLIRNHKLHNNSTAITYERFLHNECHTIQNSISIRKDAIYSSLRTPKAVRQVIQERNSFLQFLIRTIIGIQT